MLQLKPLDYIWPSAFRYEDHVGSKLTPPLGDKLRVDELGPLVPKQVTVEGRSWRESAQDIVIAGKMLAATKLLSVIVSSNHSVTATLSIQVLGGLGWDSRALQTFEYGPMKEWQSVSALPCSLTWLKTWRSQALATGT